LLADIDARLLRLESGEEAQTAEKPESARSTIKPDERSQENTGDRIPFRK
jgi:hypothetical protein